MHVTKRKNSFFKVSNTHTEIVFDKRTWENDLGCYYAMWDEIGIECKTLDDYEDEDLEKAGEG
jgi:hypothetical protein